MDNNSNDYDYVTVRNTHGKKILFNYIKNCMLLDISETILKIIIYLQQLLKKDVNPNIDEILLEEYEIIDFGLTLIFTLTKFIENVSKQKKISIIYCRLKWKEFDSKVDLKSWLLKLHNLAQCCNNMHYNFKLEYELILSNLYTNVKLVKELENIISINVQQNIIYYCRDIYNNIFITETLLPYNKNIHIDTIKIQSNLVSLPYMQFLYFYKKLHTCFNNQHYELQDAIHKILVDMLLPVDNDQAQFLKSYTDYYSQKLAFYISKLLQNPMRKFFYRSKLE